MDFIIIWHKDYTNNKITTTQKVIDSIETILNTTGYNIDR